MSRTVNTRDLESPDGLYNQNKLMCVRTNHMLQTGQLPDPLPRLEQLRLLLKT